MNKNNLGSSTLMGLLVASMAITPCAAQDNKNLESFNETSVLEEIIVTARKREESLQDTPVAISALGADELQDAGIANMRDLQAYVPGLNYSEQGNKSPSIFIRGVGQRESNSALDPGVGVYINNIYISRTDSQLLDTVDTESVQVLRGPQGTLFGKNNTGGAILVTTKAPHTEGLEGYVNVRVGNFGRKDAKIGVNIPLNDDSLAVRMSVNSVVMDGYLESDYDGKKYGDENRLAATARVSWQANDIFSADLFTYWNKQNEQGVGYTCIFQNPDATLPQFSWPGDAGKRSTKKQCQLSEQLADDDKILINGPSRFKMTSEIVALTLVWEFDDLEIKSITAYSQQSDILINDDYDGTDITAVTYGTQSLEEILAGSMAGYQQYVEEGGVDLVIPESRPSHGSDESDLSQDDTFADHGELDDEKRKQFSQEIQIIGSALDESLSYTAGIFFAKEDLDNTVFSTLTGLNGYSYYTDFASVVQKLIGSTSDLDNETYAFYTQATYDINDWFQLTGGIRYTVEDREREATIYAGNCTAIHTLNLIPGTINTCAAGDTLLLLDPEDFLDNSPDFLPVQLVQYLYTVPEDRPDVDDADGDGDTTDFVATSDLIFTDNGVIRDKKRYSKWTPTVTASLNIPEEYFENSFMDSSLIYLTWSEGFKAGGLEMKGAQMVEFEPENVTNYELGWKMDAFENRVRFNMALYQMDYEDMQIRIAETGKNLADIFLYVSNAGDATIRGLEMEVMAVPINKLTIHWSMNYTDASYDEFLAKVINISEFGGPKTVIVDRSDEAFGSIPKLTYSLTTFYNFHTAMDGIITPRLTMYYRDEVYTGIDEVAYKYKETSTIDSYLIFNFRLSFAPADYKYNTTLFVNNLTDEDYYQGGFSQSANVGAATLIKASPRSYGLEVTYHY